MDHEFDSFLEPAPSRRRRPRQVIGVVITVVVLLVAYGAQYFPIGRSAHVSLVPVPPAGCDPGVYPPGVQYRFEQCWEGQPVTWQRCATLTVAVDPADAPAGWEGDVAGALAQLSRATGLRFKTVTHGSGDIDVAWSSTLMAPAGSEHDKAGLTDLRSRSDNLGASWDGAEIRISTRLSSGAGFDGELPVLLHELGHAVGLAHFTGPVVMNPVDSGFASYQSGDLEGLARLYDPASCG